MRTGGRIVLRNGADCPDGAHESDVYQQVRIGVQYDISTALGSGFGWWSLTEQQMSAVAGVVTAIPGVGGALFARQCVLAETTRSTGYQRDLGQPEMTQAEV